MTLVEGTIQFHCTLEPANPARSIPIPLLAELDGWRTILWRLRLVGREATRYDGYGFGNLSVRDPHDDHAFHITATQTGALQHIGVHNVCRVVEWDVERFMVRAEGHALPSSETLTHAMIYDADARVNWIFHVHDPDTWPVAARLALPLIAPEIAYGSTAMAKAVAQLLTTVPNRPLLFATSGHEDGIFACGDTAQAAGGVLLATLARALATR